MLNGGTYAPTNAQLLSSASVQQMLQQQWTNAPGNTLLLHHAIDLCAIGLLILCLCVSVFVCMCRDAVGGAGVVAVVAERCTVHGASGQSAGLQQHHAVRTRDICVCLVECTGGRTSRCVDSFAYAWRSSDCPSPLSVVRSLLARWLFVCEVGSTPSKGWGWWCSPIATIPAMSICTMWQPASSTHSSSRSPAPVRVVPLAVVAWRV